jgi:hypothetical protein
MGILYTTADLLHSSICTFTEELLRQSSYTVVQSIIYLWLCLQSDTYVTYTCTPHSVATYM